MAYLKASGWGQVGYTRLELQGFLFGVGMLTSDRQDGKIR
jgi:hypothetical protein